MQKYADHELLSLVDNTVPPVDVNAVGITRAVLFKYQREARVFISWQKNISFLSLRSHVLSR